MNILHINSSARSTGSHSSKLAGDIVSRLLAAHPGSAVTVRDLGRNPVPEFDEATLQAFFTPAEQRTPAQAERAAQSEALIEELRRADAVVLGVPMYNFGVPAALKNWIDNVARAGITFKYTDKGPVGLLQGKKVYITLARGGLYRDTPADTQVPYLKSVLGFLGMTDIQFVYAEGVAMGPDAEKKALDSAAAQIDAIFAGETAAA